MKRIASLIIALLAMAGANAAGRIVRIDSPKATVYLPPQPDASGRAIVDCPGGGYSHLSVDNEGHYWAPFFNELGLTYVVLEYTLPGADRTLPLADVETTFKLLADSAEAWHVNPSQIGIMGFSAGGHLASTVATHPTKAMTPAFQILFYPVVSLENGLTHKGTRRGFLGDNPDDATVRQYSNMYQVTGQTPQAFIALSADDTAVPPANSLMYADALVKAKVPVALHMYPAGGHGWGYRTRFADHDRMLAELSSWLRSLK